MTEADYEKLRRDAAAVERAEQNEIRIRNGLPPINDPEPTLKLIPLSEDALRRMREPTPAQKVTPTATPAVTPGVTRNG